MATPFEFNMDPYKYDPIIHHEHAFRILRLFPGTGAAIVGEIIHASLEDTEVIEYEAISYVWGSSELTNWIHIKNKSLKITNNLYLVLCDLQLSDRDRWLWVDGICIDQDRNDAEKSHQVRQMSRIYNRAESVVFHLGRPTELTPILRETLLAIQERQRLQPTNSFEMTWLEVHDDLVHKYFSFHERIRSSVESILSVSWFKRVWVIQEVASARRASIQWGYASLPVKFFVSLVGQLGVSAEIQQRTILDMMPQKRRAESSWASRQDLLDLLTRFAGSEAARDHDKIFALLGMCKDGKGHGTIDVDYSRDLNLMLRKAIAYMLFCQEDDVPHGSCNITALTKSIGFLLGDVVEYLAIYSRLNSLQSLVDNRRDDLVLSERVLRNVFAYHKARKERDQQHYLAGATGNEILRILLNLRRDKISMTEDLLESAIPIIDYETIPLLMEHCPDNTARTAHLLENVISRDGNEKLRSLLGNMRAKMPNAYEYLATAKSLRAPLTPLWQAVVDGNSTTLRKVLDEGADVTYESSAGLSPLGWAVAKGREDIALALLENHANTEAGLEKPLCLAVDRGDVGIVKLLLHYGANIKSLDSAGRTPLSLAASGGCRAILSVGKQALGLIAYEFFPDALGLGSLSSYDYKHYKPVAKSRKHVGIYHYNKDSSHRPKVVQVAQAYSEIVDLLLQKNAAVDCRDRNGLTPLWWAVNYGHLAVTEKLLRNNANFHSHLPGDMTLLSWAMWNGHIQVAQKLLDQYTKLVEHNSLARVEKNLQILMLEALLLAICSSSDYHVRHLLTKSSHITDHASINLAATALSLAVDEDCTAIARLAICDRHGIQYDHQTVAHSRRPSAGDETFMQFLFDDGANINGHENQNEKGRASLIRAVRNLEYTIVKQLSGEGTNPDVHDHISIEIHLETTSRYEEPAIAELLLKRKVNIHARIPSNEPILHHAAILRGNHEILTLLLKYGQHFALREFAGMTTLMIACLQEHMATGERLLASDVNIRAKHSEGVGIQGSAKITEHKSVMQLLENSLTGPASSKG